MTSTYVLDLKKGSQKYSCWFSFAVLYTDTHTDFEKC